MDVDKASPVGADGPGELKIKGQAEFERRKSKWEAEGDDIVRIVHADSGLVADYLLLFCF
jgi:hypothetical protein